MRLLVHVREVPHLELGRQVLDEHLEGRGARVRVDEDETRPRADARLRQMEGLVADVGKVPSRRHVLQCTVEVPGEAVERASKLAAVPVLILQPPAPVETRVGVRLDVTRGGADDEERHRRDLVDVMVTWLGDVLFAACELPHPLPEPFDLEVVPADATCSARPECRPSRGGRSTRAGARPARAENRCRATLGMRCPASGRALVLPGEPCIPRTTETNCSIDYLIARGSSPPKSREPRRRGCRRRAARQGPVEALPLHEAGERSRRPGAAPTPRSARRWPGTRRRC